MRELRAAIESAFVLGDGATLAPADLPVEVAAPFVPRDEGGVSSHAANRPMDGDGDKIRRALERTAGDHVRAAALLGVSRTTLWRRMRAFGLVTPRRVIMMAHHRRLVCVAALGLTSSACYSTMPPHLAEGTEVLRPGQVNLNVAGGAGYGERVAGESNDAQFGAGFEGAVPRGPRRKAGARRKRHGWMGTSVGGGDPPFALGGKLSYKVAPLPWLAFVASGGAMDYAVSATAVIGGDLAVIVAPYTAANGNQLYIAAKGSFIVPVLKNATGIDEAIIVPIGLSFRASERVRFYVEAGPIAGFYQQSNTTTSITAVGGYSVVALTFLLR